MEAGPLRNEARKLDLVFMTYRLRFETVSEELIEPYVELSKTEYEGIGACDPNHMS